jgi:hypothetical protein
MKKIKDDLKCGGCGGVLFKLRSVGTEDDCRFGGGSFGGTLEACCKGCGSRSKIYITVPKLQVEGDDKGTICGGWRD